jgi:glycolate oxidase
LIVDYEGEAGSMKGKDYEKIMKMRDGVYPFVAGEGYTRIEDPKVITDRFPKLMEWLEEKGIPTFGHIGTGIMHPCFNVDQERHIPEMMKLVKRLGGQVSGEHGIGILKRGFVEINDQKILRNLKKRTDPAGKFNAGKVV